MKHLVIALALAVLAPVAAQAATVTLNPAADAALVQAFSGQNFGQTDNLVVERIASQNYSRALFRFDLSTIPSGSTISSAMLTLWPWSFTTAGNVDMNFYRAGATWNETDVTWGNQPALGDLIRTVTITGEAVAKTFDLTTAVQNWHAGSWENTGFAIVGEENSSKTYRRGFWSREGGGPPTLAVEYTAPSASPPAPPSETATTTPPAPEPSPILMGRLVKLACPSEAAADHACRAVYYVGADNVRHVFPSGKVFFTWYVDWSGVQTVTEMELVAYPLGANVRHKPGVRMVKRASDPKVYAVARGGVLRHITTEEVATALYGTDWNKKIDDISDVFASAYTIGASVVSAGDFSPSTEQSVTIDAEF